MTAYFIYGFVTALVMVLIVGGLYAWVTAGRAHKLTWIERRLGLWHRRKREKPPRSRGGNLTGGR